MKLNNPGNRAKILLIDDEEIMHDVMSTLLKQEGHHLDHSYDAEGGVEMFASDNYDLVLLDLMLPGTDGIQVLKQIRSLDPNSVVIMITAYGTIETAVRATKEGAYNFLTKPFNNDEILLVIKNGLRQRELVVENLYLRQSFKTESAFEAIVGKSHQMQEIFRLIQQVASTKTTVLILGESGTGKELVAKAIHNASPRADKPFIPINCGNIPTELLESELFGYKRGAFTGATKSKKGLFEVANGGTIFLDEVTSITLELQAKLLRVIQEKEFRPLGDVESRKVDVRIVAASNEALKELVSKGEFREDLYYRLNVINIELPPLRKRKEDIPLLVEHFIKKICRENDKPICAIDKKAMEILMDYPWPGNVRELENVIERSVVLSGSENLITPDLFPPEMRDATKGLLAGELFPDDGVSLKKAVKNFEKNLILQALRKTSGNQKQAAQLLRLNPTTLNEKIKRLNISFTAGKSVF